MSLQFGSNSFYPKFLNETRPRKPPRRRSLTLASQQKRFLCISDFARARFFFLKGKENFFAGWRVVASGGGLASLVPFKIGSSKVYNYSTKTNLFGIDCSARRVRRAPQGKIRFCFRREIPEFAPITIWKSSDQTLNVFSMLGNLPMKITIK